MHTVRVLAVLIAGTVAAGCAGESSRRVVVWSDIPEVAAYLELFNASQDSYRAELRYHDRPGEHLRRAEEQPDIVITRHLANRDTAGLMHSLDRLLSSGRVDPGGFYGDLLQHGEIDGTQRFLPLSFDLPTIMFNRQAGLKLATFAIGALQLREHGAAFNERSGGRYTNMGFSPQWSEAFLYAFVQTAGTGFREQDDEMPKWDQEQLEQSLQHLIEWDAESNEGSAEVGRFADRYLYDPDYQLLIRDRIGFAYTTAREFFSMRESQRKLLDYRWFGDGDIVRVLDGPVSLGVPRTGANRSGAETFIEWLYRRETHEALLQDLQRKRVRAFGILGGFSALIEVNEHLFPRYYPELLGRIPPERFLRFPDRQPIYWQSLRSDEIEPWLRRRLSQNGAEQTLEQRLRTWLLRRGD